VDLRVDLDTVGKQIELPSVKNSLGVFNFKNILKLT
jgi:hypothetical protein